MANKSKANKLDERSNLMVEVIREFRKITWPKSSEFKKTSFIVMVFVAMYIIYIGFLDVVLKKCFDLLFG